MPLFSDNFLHPLPASQAQVVGSWPAKRLFPVASLGNCTASPEGVCRSKPSAVRLSGQCDCRCWSMLALVAVATLQMVFPL